LAKNLLYGTSPNCGVGRRTLQERAFQRAVTYSGIYGSCSCIPSTIHSFLGGVKHTPITLPSRPGHQLMVLCSMSTIAVMYMPHLHRLSSDPNLILSETLTFSSYLASRALLRLLDVPSSFSLLVLILDFCHKKKKKKESNVIDGITTNTKIHVQALGRMITMRFFFGNITPSRCTNQIKKRNRITKISARK